MCKSILTFLFFFSPFRVWNDYATNNAWENLPHFLRVCWMRGGISLLQPLSRENHHVSRFHLASNSRAGDEAEGASGRPRRPEGLPEFRRRQPRLLETIGLRGNGDPNPWSISDRLLCFSNVPPGRELDLLWIYLLLLRCIRYDRIRRLCSESTIGIWSGSLVSIRELLFSRCWVLLHL